MAINIPTVVPTQIVAGDTATWKISLSDFSAADGWALTYALLRRTGGVRITITATASGADHLVSEPATTTSGWLPGDYDVQAYVTKTTERQIVWTGRISVLQNFAVAENGLDTRSQARKIFDALEEAISNFAVAQQASTSGSITEWQCEGLRIKRGSADLLFAEISKQRDRYAAIVRSEEEKISRASGRSTGRRILTRFTTP